MVNNTIGIFIFIFTIIKRANRKKYIKTKSHIEWNILSCKIDGQFSFKNCIYTRIHSIPEYILYQNTFYQNTFYTRIHSIPEYILYQNTFYTRIHSIPEYILYQNTFYTRIHSIPEYILYQNTFFKFQFICHIFREFSR